MKEYRGFIQVEEKIGEIIRPILGKKKGNFAAILSLQKAWDKLIGEKFYQFCDPKEIKFPKNKKNDGSLIIKAYNPSTAFFLEVNSSQIIERIAVYYGYKIISKIIIHQEPRNIKPKSKKIKKISQEREEVVNKSVENISDPELKEILGKLGKLI